MTGILPNARIAPESVPSRDRKGAGSFGREAHLRLGIVSRYRACIGHVAHQWGTPLACGGSSTRLCVGGLPPHACARLHRHSPRGRYSRTGLGRPVNAKRSGEPCPGFPGPLASRQNSAANGATHHRESGPRFRICGWPNRIGRVMVWNGGRASGRKRPAAWTQCSSRTLPVYHFCPSGFQNPRRVYRS